MQPERPTLADLFDALPAGFDDADPREPSARGELRRLLADAGSRSIPTGRLTRMWSLGTLQAKIAVAYLAWWLRSGFLDEDAKRRGLDETHLAAAVQILGRMSYLRGAVMKVGQVIAHWPHVAPAAFAEVLSRLHMNAPPMHFALLRELARRELGPAQEELFAEFETEAFAAASIGQVHRARLQSGERVAVKIQYPDIARTIREDLRNMKTAAFPLRLTGDWHNLLEQFEAIREMLDQEVDYRREAALQREARETLADLDDVVVPRVVDELSTERVLTMELLEGAHLHEFLAAGPSQETRDRHGAQIARASMRQWYSGRTLYADPHPGNYLFLPDGRLGLIDFGCCHRIAPAELEYLEEMEDAFDSGDEERVGVMLARGCALPPGGLGPERMALMREYSDWLWEPIRAEGAFDFATPGHFERGARLYGEFCRRRWTRSVPVNVWLTKLFFGLRAMLTHLGARVPYGEILREEVERGKRRR